MSQQEPTIVLHIDETIESSTSPKGGLRSAVFRVLKWLDSHTPFILVERIGRGRRSVEIQMAARDCFPSQAWAATGIPESLTRALLSDLCAALQLPNAFVLPNDPLRLLFTPGFDELCVLEGAILLQDKFGIARADVTDLLMDDGTAKDLVEVALRRR